MAKKQTKTTKTQVKKTKEEIIDLTIPSTEPEQALPSAGLGDTIAKVTSALGITPCEGCKKRQNEYNKIYPWLKAGREITQEEAEFIRSIQGKNTMSSGEANQLFWLYNSVFPSKRPVQRCNCPGTIIKLIQRLDSFI